MDSRYPHRAPATVLLLMGVLLAGGVRAQVPPAEQVRPAAPSPADQNSPAGQGSPADQDAPADADSPASQAPADGAARTSVSSAGVRRYQRGHWGALRINGTNPTGADVQGVTAAYLEHDPRTQFVRRFWLPAGSARSTWLPILPPESIARDRTQLSAFILQLVAADHGEQINRRRDEQLVRETTLILDPSVQQTAVILPSHPIDGWSDGAGDEEAFGVIGTSRMLHDERPVVLNLAEPFLPPHPQAYDGLDQLVICSDRITDDSGALHAVRDWLARGGRIWIMLDRVGLDTAKALLGNALCCEVVDRVQLNAFTIDTIPSARTGTALTDHWQGEQPVEFVRTTVESATVHCRIGQWPAAFTVPLGNGQALVTTLAPRGWQYPDDPFAEPSGDDPQRGGPTAALHRLSNVLYAPGKPYRLPVESLKPIVSQQLGYRIPPRSTAAAVLLMNGLLIAVPGIWWARRQQLQRIAWLVPLVCAGSAAGLVVVGQRHSSSVPPTVASFSLIHVAPGNAEAYSDTLAAFYSPQSTDLDLRAEAAEVIVPEVDDLAGVAKRVTWDDSGASRWEGVGVRGGAPRFVAARSRIDLAQPLRAVASFGPAGLVGHLQGVEQIVEPTDSVVAVPHGPAASVRLAADGGFTLDRQLLDASEFIPTALLTDEQQRRQAAYRAILEPHDGNGYPRRPAIYVWSSAASWDQTHIAGFEPVGSSLYCVPLELYPVRQHARFLVPAPFVRMENLATRSGASSVYDPVAGVWRKDNIRPTNALFRFILPDEVLPCSVQRVQIELKVHAPARRVSLFGVVDGREVTIAAEDSPSGVLRFTVDQPDLLQVDENGALRFGVAVAPTAGQMESAAASEGKAGGARRRDDDISSIAPWHIEYMRLAAAGEKLSP